LGEKKDFKDSHLRFKRIRRISRGEGKNMTSLFILIPQEDAAFLERIKEILRKEIESQVMKTNGFKARLNAAGQGNKEKEKQ
jgi:hypothetical protein